MAMLFFMGSVGICLSPYISVRCLTVAGLHLNKGVIICWVLPGWLIVQAQACKFGLV